MVIMQTWFTEFVEAMCPSENVMHEVKQHSKFIADQLVGKIDSKSGLSVSGVFLSGCNANCPTIRNPKANEFELDIFIYIQGENVENVSLPLFLKSKLESIYADTNIHKFLLENNTVKMSLNPGMKIILNLVPVIQEVSELKDEWKGYILQEGIHRPIDAVPEMHHYLQTRTNASRPPVFFNRMAKLMNWWSRCQGLRYKNNEMIFLTGNSFDKNIFPSDWFQALDQVFYSFTHCLNVPENTKDRTPVVTDPINEEYNLLSGWSKFDIEKFEIKTQESYNKLYDAKIAYDANDQKDSINSLRDMFGREFYTNT